MTQNSENENNGQILTSFRQVSILCYWVNKNKVDVQKKLTFAKKNTFHRLHLENLFQKNIYIVSMDSPMLFPLISWL